MSGDSTTNASSNGGPRRPSNRRDLILEAAINLFHQNGYPATGVDDIGEAVDVSGPAIYRHFSSKEEILLDAIRLAADEVYSANKVALASGAESEVLLEAFLRAYARVAIQRSALISVWTSEARHLNPARRSPMSKRLRAWRDEWVDVLLTVRPEIDAEQGTVLVGGAIGLITTVATTNRTKTGSHSDALLEDRAVAMAMAALNAKIY